MIADRFDSLVIVGGASLDRLHREGKRVRVAGGAGLYAALAAARAGLRVTMFGPRPRPMPVELAAAAQRIEWLGPSVEAEELPSFELAYEASGRRQFDAISWGAESALEPADLPAELETGPALVIALEEPKRQLEFVRHFRAAGQTVACGAFLGAIERDRASVEAIFAEADVFFCNEREAERLFGSADGSGTRPGRLLFVTHGAAGVSVFQGDHRTKVEAPRAREVDPTGAGDTFCGATLAALGRGLHPVMAARYGTAAAAVVVGGIGPAEILDGAGPIEPPPPAGVAVDDTRVGAIAEILAHAEVLGAYSFVAENFPAPGDPAALELFFALTFQQFGFWRLEKRRYLAPIYGVLDARRWKGSDYLAAAYERWRAADPAGLAPEAQRILAEPVLAARLGADGGDQPLAGELETRVRLANTYGETLEALGLAPADIVAQANASDRPLATFLGRLDHIGGYREDPLRKKAALLAMILRQRPERFLRSSDEELPPIVDYHVQRSCLRTGLVRLEDPDLRARNERREQVGAEEEWGVRFASYLAVERLRRASGRSMGAIDRFLFENRERCPEMSEPQCQRCPLDPSCAHQKTLFQPVFPTSFY